jgi:SAM-dependent methyltransferase
VTADPPLDRVPSATEPDPAAWIARRVTSGDVLIVGGDIDGLATALADRGATVTVAPADVPGELPYPAAGFDTVIMDRVLEHSLRPDRLLNEARRVLKEAGVLVIAARYGLQVHGDHADGLYLRRLADLLAPSFTLEAVDVARGVVLAAASPGAGPVDPAMLLEVAERRLADADTRIYQAESVAEAQRARAERIEASMRTMRSSRGWLVARAVREATRSPKDLSRLPRLISDAFRRKPSPPRT